MMVPGVAFSPVVSGSAVLLVLVFDSASFPVGETVGVGVFAEVFVLVVRVVGVTVGDCELFAEEGEGVIEDEAGDDPEDKVDDGSGDSDENAVDVIPREAVVVSAVLEGEEVMGDSLLGPTLAVPVGGKSQVHLKLKIWPPAPVKSIWNCIWFTPQSVLLVPSQ